MKIFSDGKYLNEIKDNFKEDSVLTGNGIDMQNIDISFMLDEKTNIVGLKEKYQKIMLVGAFYGREVQNAVFYGIKNKLNLTFVFSNVVTVIDPLGNIWYVGTDMNDAIKAAKDRLTYLIKITRQRTFKSDSALALAWYFDSFKVEEQESDNIGEAADVEKDFLDVIHSFSKQIYPMMGVDLKEHKRPEIRCAKTMPSFRYKNKIFVSKRVVPDYLLRSGDFVEVYMDSGKLIYFGEEKPSVDSPVHVRLYELLPNINYIVHMHEYIEGAPFTKTNNPCGAIEEYDAIEEAITEHYIDNMCELYTVNLKGHGSVVMSSSIEKLQSISLRKRNIPEIMF